MTSGKVTNCDSERPGVKTGRRIAWVSPLTDWTSHSAQFTASVMQFLPENWHCDIYVDSVDLDKLNKYTTSGQVAQGPQESGVWEYCGRRVFHFHRLAQVSSSSPYDRIIFQLEDSSRCQFVRLAAEIFPGIVFAHDLNLNRLYHSVYRHTTAASELDNFSASLFGDRGPKLGEYHVRGWSAEIFDSRFSAGIPAQAKRVVVVANRASESRLTQINKESTSSKSAVYRFAPPVLSSYLANSGSESGRETVRETAGLSEADALFAFSPSQYLADRVGGVLDAFASYVSSCECSSKKPGVLLWIIKSEQDEIVLKKSRINRAWSNPSVASRILVQRVSEQTEYLELLNSADATIALRSDNLRALPRIVWDSMGCSIPVIVGRNRSGHLQDGIIVDVLSDAGEIPPSSALMVSLGRGEVEELVQILLEFSKDKSRFKQLGERGFNFVSESCDPSRFFPFLERVMDDTSDYLKKELMELESKVEIEKSKMLSSSISPDSMSDPVIAELGTAMVEDLGDFDILQGNHPAVCLPANIRTSCL